MFKAKNEAEAQKIIREARSILLNKGWCQGIAMDSKGRFCAIGALVGAAGNLGYGGLGPSREVIGLVAGAPQGSLPQWNDAPGRTKAEVLEVFKVAYTIAGDI